MCDTRSSAEQNISAVYHWGEIRKLLASKVELNIFIRCVIMLAVYRPTEDSATRRQEEGN